MLVFVFLSLVEFMHTIVSIIIIIKNWYDITPDSITHVVGFHFKYFCLIKKIKKIKFH